MLIYITAFFTSLCIKLVMLMLVLSNPVLRTPAQYGETPRYYRPYSLSLVKVSPHIFSKFNPLYTDTFFGPLSVLILESLSKDDGNGNENSKKAMGLD